MVGESRSSSEVGSRHKRGQRELKRRLGERGSKGKHGGEVALPGESGLVVAPCYVTAPRTGWIEEL